MTVVGEMAPVALGSISRDALSGYLAISGDGNPVHFDPAVAAIAGLADTPVPGLLAMALMERAVRHWFAGREVGEFQLSFAAPILPDAALVADARPAGTSGGNDLVRVRLLCDGKIAAIGVLSIATGTERA